ncbi:g4923 [Coccomyxa viridis]|uniref:G4923 protein n=1 Tax=Coccomyxa viridis TaxID=1274662 RepID=A0ABP1FRI1_9CHLO
MQANVLVGGLIACSVAILSLWQQRRRADTKLVEAKRQLDAERRNRASERTGRIRAEKKLRERESSKEESSDSNVPEIYPLQPIGHLQSCFTKRSGTPRQPLLVPAARARLLLRQDIPAGCLEGLEQYSHVWVIFVFHCNTDLQRLWSPDHASDGLKAKVQVPRLNGGRMGVLATRSPHRPSPIGLSVAEVIEVKGRSITLGGADIVDGSPILDIKPYVPFCDSVSQASAPSWVSDEASDDPIALKDVQIRDDMLARLEACWAASGPGGAIRHALYKHPEDWVGLVRQVLRLDIRSLHQRKYSVTLHGVTISYDILPERTVLVRGAYVG